MTMMASEESGLAAPVQLQLCNIYIKELHDIVRNDDFLNTMADRMFVDAIKDGFDRDGNGEPAIKSFHEFLLKLEEIVSSKSCEYNVLANSLATSLSPSGFVGTPINAILMCPMKTNAGRAVFSNNLINRQLQKILQHWAADFIYTSRSLYSLVETDLSASPPYIGWLSEQAKADLVEVVNSATGSVLFKQEFHEIFLCDPTKYAFGFSCWDDFFARSFREEIRPVEDPDDVRVIVSPCEAAPLRVSHSVKEVDKFWVKGQPYSIRDILNRHESADDFIGGTIYQAFLSAKSYHRWHAPIGGTVIDVCRIEGSYYLQNKEGIFFGEDRSDSDSQQNNKSLLIEDSQPFLSAVAARCVILIESENTKVGKVAIVFIGMVEISSTEVTVKVGQHVKKGEEIGSFHVGGSSVQVIFERGVEIEWIDRIKETGRGEYKSFVDLDQRNIAVSSKIGTFI